MATKVITGSPIILDLSEAGGGQLQVGNNTNDNKVFLQGVSTDGSVIVGVSGSASGGEAFRWTAGGGMVGIGDLPNGTFSSVGVGVSSDGADGVGGGACDVTLRRTARPGKAPPMPSTRSGLVSALSAAVMSPTVPMLDLSGGISIWIGAWNVPFPLPLYIFIRPKEPSPTPTASPTPTPTTLPEP